MTPRPSKYSRKHLLLNGTGILASRVTAMAVSFLVTPIIVSNLHMTGYGAWESVLSLAVMCNIFHASVAASLLWVTATAVGEGDEASARNYIRMASFFSLAAFCAVTPIVWRYRGELAQLLSLQENLQNAGDWLLPCVVGLTLLASVNEFMNSFISGHQRSGVSALVLAGSAIAGNAATFILVRAGLGHMGLLIGHALTIATSFAGLLAVSRSIVPGLSIWPILPTRLVLRRCAPFAGFMMLGVLAAASREQADKLIIATTATPDWVGYYGIASRLANLVMVVCSFLYVPTMAAVGALGTQPDANTLNRIYDDASTLTILSVGLASVLIGSLSDRLTMLWMGRPIPEVDRIVLLMLTGIALATLLTSTGTAMCRGLGMLHVELKYIVLALGTNAVLKTLLVPHVGAVGSVVASFASWGIASIVFVVLFHRATKIARGASVRLGGAVVAGLVTTGVVRCLGGTISPEQDSIAQLLAIAFTAVSAATLYLGLLLLTRIVPSDVVRKLPGALRSVWAGR